MPDPLMWGDTYDFLETPDGLPIMGIQEFNGKLLVFTSEHVYTLKKITGWRLWIHKIKQKAGRWLRA